MHVLGKIFVDILTVLFFAGLAGSVIVIAISFVEDFRELFGPDEKPEKPATPAQSGPPSGADKYAVSR